MLRSSISGTLLHLLSCPSNASCVCVYAKKLRFPLAFCVIWVFCTFANLISTGHWNKFILKILTHGLGTLMLSHPPTPPQKKTSFCYLIFSQGAPQPSEIPTLEVLLVWAMSFWAVQHFILTPLVSAWQYFDLRVADRCHDRLIWSFSSNAVLYGEGPRGGGGV